MSSTYSTSLRIQLITTGTELEAWGTPTDNNLGTIIEQAITGVESVSINNLTSYTLTTANAVADQARNAVVVLTGNLNANCNVIVPSVEKVYIVNNRTTNNKVVTFKTSGGNGVQISANSTQLVYCNSVDVNSAIDVNNIIGDLTVTGSENIGGNLTATTILVNGSLTSSSGNITMTSNSNVVTMAPSTGGFVFPSGTNSQRPSSPVVGMSRWNTQLGWYEIWNGTIWQQITGSFNVNYIVVAGGGAGGTYSFSSAGGGGAGGYLAGTATLAPGTNYTITVGSGGTAGYFTGTKGANSSAFSVTAIGGGYGAYGPSYSVGSGGSGGGGAADANYGSGTSGQGNAGGAGRGDPFAGGGGGGAGAQGGSASGTGGAGGIGVQSSITGTATYYAGGGGGGGSNESGGQGGVLPGAGGSGGGGYGGYGGPDGGGAVATSGVAGTPNTGGGGGGAARVGQYGGTGGGNGGSGVVIVSYAYPTQRGTGGTVTSYSSGGSTYWVHTFTSSGTFAT